MPLTFNNLTTATSTTSSTVLTTSAVTVAEGEWILVCVGADNAGTAGAASLSSVTDQNGNKYELLSLINNDPGSASAGITLGIFLARASSALLSRTISVNFSAATTSKACLVYRVSVGNGERVGVVQVGPGATSSGATTQTITDSLVDAGDTIVGVMACEARQTTVADSDTVNGTWSTQYSAVADNGGTNSASATVVSQYKTVMASGSQTYNTSNSFGPDAAINYVVLRPVPEGYWAVNGATMGV